MLPALGKCLCPPILFWSTVLAKLALGTIALKLALGAIALKLALGAIVFVVCAVGARPTVAIIESITPN